jgi:hypothetical protein
MGEGSGCGFGHVESVVPCWWALFAAERFQDRASILNTLFVALGASEGGEGGTKLVSGNVETWPIVWSVVDRRDYDGVRDLRKRFVERGEKFDGGSRQRAKLSTMSGMRLPGFMLTPAR